MPQYATFDREILALVMAELDLKKLDARYARGKILKLKRLYARKAGVTVQKKPTAKK